jgi:pilus assembly protein CpaF
MEEAGRGAVWEAAPPATSIAPDRVSVDVILPFLRPLEPYLTDAQVSDVMVNAGGRVFVERNGELRQEDVTIREGNLRVAVRNLARVLGDEVSEERPLLDARLHDGSRVAAVLPPVSLLGTTLTIRKFHSRRFVLDELVRIGTMTEEVRAIISAAVRARQNVLISGGTGTGKTTLLTALTALLPATCRVLVIEDTAELQIQTGNLIRFEARRAQRDIPAVTMRELVRASLRHRPDRILIGEVRGGEAFDLLQVLNTGHSGSLSTIHANSAAQALNRFTACVLESGVELPHGAIRYSIAQTVGVVVHLERRDGRRVVTEVVAVEGYDPASGQFQLRAAAGDMGTSR